jgi:hypothetical protein
VNPVSIIDSWLEGRYFLWFKVRIVTGRALINIEKTQVKVADFGF